MRENAEAFANHHDLGQGAVYEDHRTMVREADPDVVSVCVPPAAHAEIVIDCAEVGDVAAIHCEKPMATTWEDCREMVSVCEENDVQLTIDHQRRFAVPVRKAKELIDGGEIGDLRRLEWSEVNLFDAGSHLFDLCDFFVDGVHGKWALAGLDVAEENRWFGALNSTRAIAHWEYENGVQGLASTGEGDRKTAVDAYLRLVGTDGVIEIQPDDGPPLRVRTDGGWRAVDTDGERLYGPIPTKTKAALRKLTDAVPGVESNHTSKPNYDRAIKHAIQSLSEGTEPIIAGKNVLRGTEFVFACWESARRGGRVDLPLDIEDNPLESLYEERQTATRPV
ncbi:Gfo/Idh/MocA family oxidoreductase [Halalkaliarchaeum sp. AArc-GB]|uniref:Gfo/Idh/MocA family protein n=1 Tax=Halalkaliarchaeum sp. AArc-GB TaxID=3074078 RepID=UPI0028572E60|nr:Gfo/Idh/MocA family oxidoreductase [Halalkaliarchaeum sp. AArc-GB]MDR5674628.1 Gfo/Idh/MocA family oxidoreductase [Halalkaliarchaeum sp. AArc-GB]